MVNWCTFTGELPGGESLSIQEERRFLNKHGPSKGGRGHEEEHKVLGLSQVEGDLNLYVRKE